MEKCLEIGFNQNIRGRQERINFDNYSGFMIETCSIFFLTEQKIIIKGRLS